MGYIYIIENLINNKKYVGQTINPEHRWKRHINDDVKNPSLIIGKAFNKYGIENFTFTVIEECPDDKMDEREIYWIKTLHTYIKDPDCNGYNMTPGGEKLFGENNPFYGKTHSNETKEKLSSYGKKRIGDKNSFYGKVHSEETKKRISQANTGNKWGEESKRKASVRMKNNNPFRGKHHSEQSKKKMSDAAKNRIPYNAIKWIAKNETNEIIFQSVGQVLKWILKNQLIDDPDFTMSKLKNRLKKSENNHTKFVGYYWKKSVETIENIDENLEVSRVGFDIDTKPKCEDTDLSV